MEIKKIIDQLKIYIGFLSSFTERGDKFLRENDWISLKMTREYMIEAIRKMESLIK